MVDGFLEDLADDFSELGESGFADFSGFSFGVDASHEECFAGVDVSYSDDGVVVHDVLFDGFLFELGFCDEVACAEVVGEWFWA